MIYTSNNEMIRAIQRGGRGEREGDALQKKGGHNSVSFLLEYRERGKNKKKTHTEREAGRDTERERERERGFHPK